MTSQPLGTLGQALNCRLARGVGKVRFFYHAMAAKSQLCDKSLWVRAYYNYYLRLSSASFTAFDRLALLGDWQAFHQPPWASLSATGGRGGGAELIAVIFQSSRYVLFNQAITNDSLILPDECGHYLTIRNRAVAINEDLLLKS